MNGAEDQAALGAVHKLLEYARQRVSEATEGDLPGLSLDPYGSGGFGKIALRMGLIVIQSSSKLWSGQHRWIDLESRRES